jgi:Mrp family chromosome partitioning ATPase/predicted Fe-Mo cluster-binding NifX family protein
VERSEDARDREAIASRMNRIGHKLVVLSGKGGVGKSTVAVNLAVSLAMAGKQVGLLDVDIHGPNIPKMLDIEDEQITGTGESILPVLATKGLYVMSIGLLMQNRDDAVIWRGPMKYGVIKQFLRDVEWGKLDYLIVDCPPGTGDEPLSVVQLIENADGAIIVTTPQAVSVLDVRRSIRFSRTLGLPVVGVIENMSGFVCPHCEQRVDIFGTGGGRTMAEQMDIPLLGTIPIDPTVVASGDAGRPIVETDAHGETAKAFGRVVRKLLSTDLDSRKVAEPPSGRTTIAIPVAGDKLCLHFGHCEQFALYEVDSESRSIVNEKRLTPPPHEPGVLPRWLHGQGAHLIISGGMGARAQSLFNEHGVAVVTGAAPEDPKKVVEDYLQGALVTGENICDH